MIRCLILQKLFWNPFLSAIADKNACEIPLKSTCLGSPCCLNRLLKYSFKPRCLGQSGFTKKISMSCAFKMDFQLENSFPQSKVIDLKRWLENWDSYWLMETSISLALRPFVFGMMMAFSCLSKVNPSYQTPHNHLDVRESSWNKESYQDRLLLSHPDSNFVPNEFE